jgi:hypothetical protein
MNLPTTLRLAAFLAVAVATVLGCKKPEAEVSGDALPVPGSAGNPAAIAQVESASKAIENNDYDAAIAALLQARQTEQAMNEKQVQAYQQAVQATTTKLLDAAATDPKAREAYNNFSRLMTGR